MIRAAALNVKVHYPYIYYTTFEHRGHLGVTAALNGIEYNGAECDLFFFRLFFAQFIDRQTSPHLQMVSRGGVLVG